MSFDTFSPKTIDLKTWCLMRMHACVVSVFTRFWNDLEMRFKGMQVMRYTRTCKMIIIAGREGGKRGDIHFLMTRTSETGGVFTALLLISSDDLKCKKLSRVVNASQLSCTCNSSPLKSEKVKNTTSPISSIECNRSKIEYRPSFSKWGAFTSRIQVKTRNPRECEGETSVKSIELPDYQ
jgi:hypothetical protein